MNPFDEVLSMVGHGYKLKYICAALARIRHCTIDPDEHTAVAQAERMIRNRLGNYISMEGWLMHHVPEYREAFFDARSLRRDVSVKSLGSSSKQEPTGCSGCSSSRSSGITESGNDKSIPRR